MCGKLLEQSMAHTAYNTYYDSFISNKAMKMPCLKNKHNKRSGDTTMVVLMPTPGMEQVEG